MTPDSTASLRVHRKRRDAIRYVREFNISQAMICNMSHVHMNFLASGVEAYTILKLSDVSS